VPGQFILPVTIIICFGLVYEGKMNMEQLNNLSQTSVWNNTIPLTALKRDYLEIELPVEVKEYISEFVDLYSLKTRIINTKDPLVNDNYNFIFDTYINVQKVNNILLLNTLLSSVNNKLSINDKFVCCAETLDERKERKFGNYPKYLFYPVYFVDFLIERVIPKLTLTRPFYLQITRGENQVMSFTQILGSLVFSGFRVIDFREINGITYFICDKEKEPSKDPPPSLGLIFKMKRVGKEGKIINVYKIRTMHPYAEYLQKYVFDLNGSVNGDKITNDFRLAGWGKLLRRLWLDELPMIINLFKGDIKLVGVRPLSLFKFNTYPDDVKKLRVSTKPGLIPPFYADLPSNFDELVESERRYLLLYRKNPFVTDIKYFFKCFYNIVIKHARSA
jgi:lipopolysaccharide/colanic/teichoic acid biosynthesis glycosyltransferase